MTHVFKVNSYRVSLGRGELSLSNISCKGVEDTTGNEYSLSIFFYPAEHSFPANIYRDNDKTGQIFRPASEYAWYLDLLRNEKPIFGWLDTNNPNQHTLRTTLEPVGPGEIPESL